MLSNMAAPYWKARRRGCSFSGPILCSRERLHGSSKTFVEHSRHVAKIQFRTQPNRRVLATAGLVMTVGLVINGCSH